MNTRPDFLIVGMARSGTLWASAALNEHPDIACFPSMPVRTTSSEHRLGEMHFFNTLASLEPNSNKARTRPLSDFLTKYGNIFSDLVPLAQNLPRKEFYAIAVERYRALCEKVRENKKMVGESTPAYIFHLDFIDTLYPGIKKICSLRDPKDRVVSWHFNSISKGKKTEQKITEDFALDYVKDCILPEYESLLAYKGSVCCYTYEHMSRAPHEVVRNLLHYLNMDARNGIIEQMVKNASFDEMRRRHAETVDTFAYEDKGENAWLRKGVVGDWKNHMHSDISEKIDSTVFPLHKKVFAKYNLI